MMEDSPSLLHGKTETTAASQHPMQKTRRKRTKVWCQWRPFMNFYVRCVPWTALDAVLNSGCWGLGAISLSPSLRASPHDQPDLHGDYSFLCTKGVVFKLHRSSNVNSETSGPANIVRSVHIYIYIYVSPQPKHLWFFPGCPSVASNKVLWPDLCSYCWTTLSQVQAEVRTPHSRGWWMDPFATTLPQ